MMTWPCVRPFFALVKNEPYVTVAVTDSDGTRIGGRDKGVTGYCY
jgi:hypothetical protein